jgi:WD40 repeat protein
LIELLTHFITDSRGHESILGRTLLRNSREVSNFLEQFISRPPLPPASLFITLPRVPTQRLTQRLTVFAKPFIAQLGKGHQDSVYTMAKDPENLGRFASGSGDGIVKVWDLTSRDEIWHNQAHENLVKGMCWTKDQKLLTCAADRSIKMFHPYGTSSGTAPTATWLGNGAFTSLSHHRNKNSFAAASSVVSIYDLERHTATPEVLKWPTATDTINCVSFKYVFLARHHVRHIKQGLELL